MLLKKHVLNLKTNFKTVFICFFSLLSIVILFYYFVLETTKTPSSFTLQKEEVPSVQSAKSKVYLLSTKDKKFLIASDNAITAIPKGISLEEVHSHSFWNPNTCSRVPVLIQDHSAYFIETTKEKEGDGYRMKTTLSVLDFISKRYMMYDVSFLKSTHFVYSNGGTVYLAQPQYHKKSKIIEKITLYSFDEKSGVLTLDVQIDVSSFAIGSPIFKIERGNFALLTIDSSFNKRYFILEDKIFHETEKFQEKTISTEGSVSLFGISNSEYLSKQSLSYYDQLEIISKEQDTMVSFSNDGANKYVIGEVR
jgi:hypothetical protein